MPIKKHFPHIIVGACAIGMAAGTIISIMVKDIRPGLLAACAAWLGAEYLDHLNAKARR